MFHLSAWTRRAGRLPLTSSILRRTYAHRGPLFLALWLTLALSTLWGLLGPAELRAETWLTVIVGNNAWVPGYDGSNEPRLPDLRFADDDALQWAALLETVRPEGRVWVLTEVDDATRDDGALPIPEGVLPPTTEVWGASIEALRGSALRAASEGEGPVYVMLLFSGHGDKDGSFHFADGRLSREAVLNDLLSIGAERVVAILDGCYLATGTRGEATAPKLSFLAPMKGLRQVYGIGASTAVPELDTLEGGVISTAALSGLAGAADADMDHRVDFKEMLSFLQDQLQVWDPTVTILPMGDGRDPRATLMDLGGAHLGGVVIPVGAREGWLQILPAGGRAALFEMYNRGERDIHLALPEGHYEIRQVDVRKASREGARSYEAATLEVAVAGEVVRLADWDDWLPVRLVSEGLRGAEEGLPTKLPIRYISAREEANLKRAFPVESPSVRHRLPPRWAASGSWDGLYHGPNLGYGPGRRGVNLDVERLTPLVVEGRWMFSVGAGVEGAQHVVEGGIAAVDTDGSLAYSVTTGEPCAEALEGATYGLNCPVALQQAWTGALAQMRWGKERRSVALTQSVGLAVGAARDDRWRFYALGDLGDTDPRPSAEEGEPLRWPWLRLDVRYSAAAAFLYGLPHFGSLGPQVEIQVFRPLMGVEICEAESGCGDVGALGYASAASEPVSWQLSIGLRLEQRPY